MNKYNKFRGTGVALVTPFNKDKSIDFISLGNLVEHLIKNGIDYFVVLGTTAESATLNTAEKKQIINFIIEKVNKRIPIVVGFGGNDTQNIVENIKEQDFANIDAILSVSPYYNKPNQRGILEHYKVIADISPVPIILYNVPGRTGTNINAETTLELSKHKNIIAIKEASGNLLQIMQIIQNKEEDFLVISGDDALTFPMIMLGAAGVISVAAMAVPYQFSQMVKNALDGKFKEAKKLHYDVLNITNAIFEDGNPAGIKAVLSLQGIIENFLRLPLVPINIQLMEKIKTLV
jgi:4-hydroxy-tetrahydrodipicolinate synthase